MATKANPHGGMSLDASPIPLLDSIQERGRVWEDLAEEYGVTNPDPPWRLSLETTCDMLAAESCQIPYEEVTEDTCVIPSLDRRWEEDELSATLYADVPYPENVLLSLAHSMMSRGLFSESELASRMEEVEKRLNMA